jgi:hypothetical protein
MAERTISQEVVELLDLLDDGKLPLAEPTPEARRVAIGLHALRIAMLHFRDVHRGKSANLGLFEAEGILNALTRGQDHPVWRYIDDFRTHFAANRRPAADTTRIGRVVAIATVRALETLGSTVAQGRRDVASALTRAGWIGLVPAETIKRWEKEERKRRDEIAQLKNALLENAKTKPQVLEHAMALAKRCFSPPAMTAVSGASTLDVTPPELGR